MSEFYQIMKIKTWDAKDPEYRSKEHDVEGWLRGTKGGRMLPPKRVQWHDISPEEIKEHWDKKQATKAVILALRKECHELKTVGRAKAWVIKKTIGQVATFIDVPPEYRKVWDGG